MSRQFDAVVVGGGPAGAMTAWHLASAGFRVCVLEKKPVPRYKPCGGGISGRTRNALPFPIDEVIEQQIDGIAFDFWGKRRTFRYHRPIAWMVMRDRFDALLLARAAEAGAEVRDGEALAGPPQRADGGWRLETSSGETLAARLLIGADGANSLVARSQGLMSRGTAFVALEHEIACDAGRAEEWDGLVEIDFAYQPWGYGWVFPKADHVSVGLAVAPSLGKDIKRSLAAYRERRGLADNALIHAEGHKIPFRHPDDVVHAEGLLLVGDAAGMTDEFSAEGIFYAISSARLAADVGAGWLEGVANLAAYTAAVDRELMPELAAARGISRAFFAGMRRAPWLLQGAIDHVDYYTRTLFAVQAGETNYVEVQRRWRPLAPMWKRLNAGSLAV